MFGKVDISKWLDKEIHATELALLVAEDELAGAQLRVNALKERAVRLKDKAAVVQTPAVAISPAVAAYDRARNDFQLRTAGQ